MHTLETIYTRVYAQLEKHHLEVINHDFSRPWGGFLGIGKGSLELFLNIYFAELQDEFPSLLRNTLSPKILLVAPNKRLSWQYHLRREELWKVVAGPVGVVQSDTDIQTPKTVHKAGDLIQISYLKRHRLIGDTKWGVLAEIWKHTDPKNPSDEDDIIRISDDFGRK